MCTYYCLSLLFLFSDLCSDEIDDGDSFDSDEEETEDEDGLDMDEEVERDGAFSADEYEDVDTDSEEEDEKVDGVDDSDDEDAPELQIKFRTSVDAHSLVQQLQNCCRRNGLVNIGSSDKTYCAANRASANVKANGDLPTTMVSGILHGFSNVMKGSI